MKNLYTVILLTTMFTAGAQSFTWIKGTSNVNATGLYGTPGTAASTNVPGGRSGAAQWKDASGNFWIFGGDGYDYNGNGGLLSDLWKYNRVTNMWTFIAGDNLLLQGGRYGTQGVPSSTNNPGARRAAASWFDNNGNLWLFGGYGLGQNSGQGDLNDLWRFNISTNEWTWMGGSTNVFEPGLYDQPGVPSATAIPGSRHSMAAWESGGKFYLFGGLGATTHSLTVGMLDDVWKYDPSAGQWTWLKGTTLVDQAGKYGTPATPSPTVNPGGRMGPMFWNDGNGNLWLFGGEGFGASSASGQLNDVWKFQIQQNEWTYMSGSTAINQTGNYGALGVPHATNSPGGRSFGVTWTDAAGLLWLHGGYGSGITAGISELSDLWHYNPANGTWNWLIGSNLISQFANYGALGIPAVTNIPGSRMEANSWIDANSNLWLFGGKGRVASGSPGMLNDMWTFNNCYVGITTPTISSADSTICEGESTTLMASGGTTYTWSTVQNGPSVIITPTSTMIYTVATTNTNACVYTSAFVQTVVVCASLNENITGDEITVYPNPSQGMITLACDRPAEIIIHDISGRLILQKSVQPGQPFYTGLQQGWYVARVSSGEKVRTIKLLVE